MNLSKNFVSPLRGRSVLPWNGLDFWILRGLEWRAELVGPFEAATGIVSAKRLGRDNGLLSYRETRRIIPLHHD